VAHSLLPSIALLAPAALLGCRSPAAAPVSRPVTVLVPSAEPAPAGEVGGKLAPRDTCGASVEHGLRGTQDELFSLRVVRASGWLDAYRRLYGRGDPKADPPPAGEDEARSSLCVRHDVDRCTGAGPWVLTRFLNSAYMELEDHVFPEPGGGLLVLHTIVARTTEITMMNNLRCVTEQTLDVRREPGVVQLSIHSDWADDGAVVEPSKPCPPPRQELEDVLFDAASGRPLLRVVRPAGAGAAQVRVQGRTAEISAGTCRVTVPIG
jgi:hypothetical protein